MRFAIVTWAKRLAERNAFGRNVLEWIALWVVVVVIIGILFSVISEGEPHADECKWGVRLGPWTGRIVGETVNWQSRYAYPLPGLAEVFMGHLENVPPGERVCCGSGAFPGWATHCTVT